MTESDSLPVRNNRDASRFEVSLAGRRAELVYRAGRKRVAFLHTEVPPELEGQGIGSALAEAGLEWAREQKLRVLPYCPFVRGFITRHPEYADLVDEAWEDADPRS